jgi:hypothetical protein
VKVNHIRSVVTGIVEYTEIVLTLGTEEANERIKERVPSVRARWEGQTIEYRTNSGLLLGKLSETKLPNGETGSKLRYRTTTTSAPLSHGRTMAKKLRAAVESHVNTG